MSSGSAEELIRDLAADLSPVKPIPRIRSVVAGLVGLWLAIAGLGFLVMGKTPDLMGNLLQPDGTAIVFGGLMLAGLGGLVSSLAMGVPGRESTARTALWVAILGIGVAAGMGSVLFLRSPGSPIPHSGMTDLFCLSLAVGVSLLPALGVAAFAARATPVRPLVLVVAGAAATAALGAISAQATCTYKDPRHLMLGHVLAPAVGALLLSLPLLVALRRFGRGSGS